MKVLLVGSGEIGASLLMGILESSHNIVGVMNWLKQNTKKNLKTIVSKFYSPDLMDVIIKSNNLNEIKSKKVNSLKFIHEIEKLKPDVVLIGDCREILKKCIISMQGVIFINCHPSMLPLHRGKYPFLSVKLSGETKTGLTFHIIEQKIDTGPVLLQKEIDLCEGDTSYSIKAKCSFKAKELVGELLDNIENKTIQPQKQNEDLAYYYKSSYKELEEINWNKPASMIHDQILGVQNWTECYTTYKGKRIFIGSCKVIELENQVTDPGVILSKNNDTLIVSTGNPKYGVIIQNLKLKEIFGKIFIKKFINTQIKIGDKLQSVVFKEKETENFQVTH